MFKKLTLIIAIVAATACGGSQAEDTSNTTVVDEVSEETTTAVAEALPEGAANIDEATDVVASAGGVETATATAAVEAVEAIRCTVLSSTASAGGSLTLNGAALTSDLTVKVGGTAATVVTATGPRMDLQLPATISSGTVTVQRGTEDAVECGELTIE